MHHYGARLEDELARSPLVAADLAAMLPPGSCTMAAVDPTLSWTAGEWLMAKAVDTLRGTAWALGVIKGDRPEPLVPPGCAPGGADGEIEPFDIDEYKASHAGGGAK